MEDIMLYISKTKMIFDGRTILKGDKVPIDEARRIGFEYFEKQMIKSEDKQFINYANK